MRTAASESNPSVIPGEYFWGGYASTGFIICPRDQTVIISLAQFLPLKATLADTFKKDVDAAIEGKEIAKQAVPKRVPKRFQFRAPVGAVK